MGTVRAVQLTALALAVSTLLIACGGGSPGDQATSGKTSGPAPGNTLASCPVTLPNGNAPPRHHEPNFYGNGRLWVLLPTYKHPDGINPDGSYSKKIPWWEAVSGKQLRVSGERLDGPAPPLRAAVNEAIDSSGSFLASTVIFPTQGCWRITGQAGDVTLTFTIRLETDCKTNQCLTGAPGAGPRPPSRTPSASADAAYLAKRPSVCFTTRALHLDGGEALASISQSGRANRGTSIMSVARRSFAPNIRIAVRRLRRYGTHAAEQVASAADRGLERVLRTPTLLLYRNGDQLGQVFSHARRLAERAGFSKTRCSY
ncbi:MAG: hypothetical protein ACRDMH_01195 [Solirubrobacterales bacterium]